MDFGINYRLLYVATSEKDNNYKQLINALEDKGLQAELEKHTRKTDGPLHEKHKADYAETWAPIFGKLKTPE